MKLVRMSDELFQQIAGTHSIDGSERHVTIKWGKPIEYAIVEDHGKQYLEPVYTPTVYYNEVNEVNEDS